MRSRRLTMLVVGLSCLGSFAGCASMQRVSIETDPVGASVFLQRRGDIEVHGRIAGVVGGADVESFEEEFMLLGTAPVDYEFARREREVSVHTPYVGADVTRHYREGTIRVELDGYRVVVRRVRFSGDEIILVIPLEPVPDS